MRLPYIPDDPVMPNAEDQAIVTAVKERRGGKLIELDKALLHAPPISGGWNAFLKSVRTQNSLPASIREIAIARVAALNSAWYEWEAHAPLLQQTGEVKPEAVEKLKDRKNSASDLGLDERHAAVVEVTDAMTLNVIVPDAKMEKLKKLFSEREVVEVVATVSAYNCVMALDVGEMSEKYGVDMS
ncbi:uncharacterized protein LTR77_004964 [Saxophila tyrrhenica]|uniref:Carboxymuconolactone decarboxylase-like domain-containing protein n=1 Tax=Saxophila tyrrhenica TaxID=1690608 RepID=A0AAV9PE22_9PEZI|nr:hypothetical protein LTR77_004964 [Saxophila tyrrhenica]